IDCQAATTSPVDASVATSVSPTEPSDELVTWELGEPAPRPRWTTSWPACGSASTGVPLDIAAVTSEPETSASSGPPPLAWTGVAQVAPPSPEVMPQRLLTFEGEIAPKTASSVPSGRRTRPRWA